LFDVGSEDVFLYRHRVLQNAVNRVNKKINNSYLYCVETYKCEGMDDVLANHKTFINEKYEGTMLRLHHLPYQHNRSNQLYKIKDFQDEEFRIVGWNEEVNHPGYLGSFEVTDDADNCFAVRPAVTREIRKEYWDDRNSLIDAQLTVRYQEISKDGIPRFPIGIDVRYDL
jgi:ATP-dependent DNA ligase